MKEQQPLSVDEVGYERLAGNDYVDVIMIQGEEERSMGQDKQWSGRGLANKSGRMEDGQTEESRPREREETEGKG